MTQIQSYSDVEDRLVYNQSKLIVLKSVTKGMRNYLEAGFETSLLGIINRWTDKVISTYKREKVLEKAIEQERYLNSISLDRQAKIDKANALSKILINQYASTLIKLFPKKILITLWREYSHKQYRSGIKASVDSLGLDIHVDDIIKSATDVFTLTDAEIIHALDTRAITYSDVLIENLIEDTRVLIRDRIYLGTGTIEDVANILQEMYKLPYWRILNVTKTEAQAAFGMAQFNFYERSGVKRKHWEDVGDGKVRKQHKANTAQGWIPIDATFSSGQKHTGDGPLSNNCRCIIVPDLSDPSIVLKPWLGGSI